MSGLALSASIGAGGRGALDDVAGMLKRSPHRGRTTSTVGDHRAAVGVCRPDDRSDDASTAQRQGWLCGFAGVLDNRTELASALGLPPAADAASVVLAGYLRDGAPFANRLRGAYVAALTTPGQVVAFRDHIGLMPLFYRVAAGAVFIATEAKQVVAGAGLAMQPDIEVCTEILHQDVTDETPAALVGVRRLPKGSVFSVGPSGDVRLDRYWHPESLVETASYRDDELQERFDALMAQAVARSMRGADAVLLSGGIDSPGVAAYAAPHARERYGHPLLALSAVYPDHPAVDETPYITAAAETFGVSLHTYTFEKPHLAELQQWVQLADGPVPTVVLTDAADAYRRCRALGASTVLTGDLAEFVVDQRDHLVAHYLRRGRVNALVREVQGRRRRPRFVRRSAAEIASALLPHAVKTAVRGHRLPPVRPMLPAWLDSERHRLPVTGVKSPVGQRWREGQYRFLEGPGISLEGDEACQEFCGVRARHPWVDIDLWEFFLSLRAEQKYCDPVSKPLVRRLLRGRVPDVILDRRTKVVFNDAVMGRVDYDSLARWLKCPSVRLPGVNYDLLWQRIDGRTMDIADYMWAKDLASVHAFLALWD